MMAVRHARVICVDDMNMQMVRKAYYVAYNLIPGREDLQRKTAKKWEAYLV